MGQRHLGGDVDGGHQLTLTCRGEAGGEVVRDVVGALGDGARVVVCDLSTGRVSGSAVAEAFRPVTHYLSDWCGAGVVVVCAPGSEVWRALDTRSRPGNLVVSETPDAGLEQLYFRLPPLARTKLHLAAKLSSPRTSRLFVVRSLIDWRLLALSASASLVVSELVTNAVVHAASSVDVTLSRSDGRMQMMVRDHGAGHPQARFDEPEEHVLGGRGLLLVEEATRGWGVLPARSAGKTVWAVFDAPPARAQA